MNNDLELYALPFKEGHPDGWVRDANNNFIFMFLGNPSKEHKDKIINSLNSETHNPIIGRVPIEFEYVSERVLITLNKQDFILIRGWGNLTGIGRHNLSDGRARIIQNKLAKFILEKLNTK